jgi:hypothetical protein
LSNFEKNIWNFLRFFLSPLNFVGLHVLTPELQEEVKEKSEPSKVLRVSTAMYQHPPTISCGGAKWNRKNNGRWTKRPKETTRQRTQKN